MVEYRGHNGTIAIEGDQMVITHHGFVAKAGGLKTNSPRRINLAALSGVHLKPASALTNGVLTIGTDGAAASRRPAVDSADSVMFLKKDAAMFQSLHDWLATVVEKNRASSAEPSAPAAVARGARAGAGTMGLVRFALWGQPSYAGFEVAGEGHHSAEIARLFPRGVPEEGVEDTFEADLVPEPTNRYDANAVQVVISGNLVGYLPKEEAATYQPRLSRLANQGLLATVESRVWARPEIDWESGRRTGHIHARVSLKLAEPHLILPLNTAPSGVELPTGRAVKIAPGPGAQEACAPWLRPEGEGWVHATLHRVEEVTARSTKELVEVRIDGAAVGRMTPAMGQNFLPVIDLLDDRGLGCVVRAMVKGNRVKAEVSVSAARASELSDAWLQDHIYAVKAGTGPSPSHPADPVTTVPPLHVPAGWYADPEGVAASRYWDGTAWTSHVSSS